MNKAEKLQLCCDCRDDFYNDHNPLGVKECWHLSSARSVVRTRVGIWQNPPYEWHPEKTLSCHTPEGWAWIARDDDRISAEGGEA